MIKLKRFQKPNASNVSKRSKRYVERYIWYDSPSHKHDKCHNCKAVIKKDIIHFKKKKIRLLSFDEPIKTNFKK